MGATFDKTQRGFFASAVNGEHPIEEMRGIDQALMQSLEVVKKALNVLVESKDARRFGVYQLAIGELFRAAAAKSNGQCGG